MKRFVTQQDAIDQAIAPVLTEGDYDMEAIFCQTFAWRVDQDADGNELLKTAGFEQVVSDDAFWTAVQANEKN